MFPDLAYFFHLSPEDVVNLSPDELDYFTKALDEISTQTKKAEQEMKRKK